MNIGKDTFFNTLGNFAYLGSVWLMNVMVVRFGDFEAAGYFALALTTSNIYIAVASYTARLYYAADINQRFSDRQFFLMRIVTTAVSFLACVIGGAVLGYTPYSMSVILLFYVYKIFEMLSDILHGALQRHHKLYYAGYSMIVKAVLSLAMFVLAMKIWGELIYAVIFIDVVAIVVFCFIDIPCVYRLKIVIFPFVKEDVHKVKQLLSVCFPMLLVGICYNLIPSIPRLAFEHLYSTEEYGIFSSLSTVTVLISTAVNCIVVPIIPRLTKYYCDGQREQLKRSVFILLFGSVLFGGLSLIASALIGEWGLVILFGKEVAGYMDVFNGVIVATVFTSIVICLNSIFSAIGKQKVLLVACFMGVVVCALLTMPFCRSYYMLGVAYNLVVSQGVEIVVLIVYMWMLFRKMPAQCEKFK